MPAAQAFGSLTIQSGPANMIDSQAAYYSVTIINNSGEVWASEEPNPVHLSYHWLDEEGRPASYNGYRTKLRSPIGPGEQCTAMLRVHPPGTPGRYLLEVDVVREGVRWFEIGERRPLEVQPTAQIRAVLVTQNCILNDAVGNNLLRKLHLLHERGLAPLVLAEYIDEQVPLDDQRMMMAINERYLVDPEPQMQWAAKHFWNADLYIFDYPEYYPLLELIRLVTRGSVIFDYHSVTPPHLWQGDINRVNVERGVSEVRLVAFADYAIAHSEYTRSELLATDLITPDRVFVIPYAVPLAYFQPGRMRVRPPELQPDDGPVLLYVGRMASNKRIDVLVQVVARIAPNYPHVKLLLIGDDSAAPYRRIADAARQISVELGVQNNVVFTGPRSHDELPAYYEACDVYITSSEHEGFCIPVVEAMACGKPVVATNATALPSTVGDAGLLFEAGNVEQCAAQVLALLESKFHRPQIMV